MNCQDVALGIKEGIVLDVLHADLRKVLRVGAADGRTGAVLDVEPFLLDEKALFPLPVPIHLLATASLTVHLGSQLPVDA